MAKQPTQVRRKLLGLDEEIWHALNLLSRESMKSFQELADEAFRAAGVPGEIPVTSVLVNRVDCR
jgi:hypothetical protein